MKRPRLARHALMAGAAMLALGFVSACGGGGGGGSSAPPPAASPPPPPPPPPPPTIATELFVAPNGDDANPGTEAAPLASIQAAVDLADPGTRIEVAQGTYAEQVLFDGQDDSGTETDPIILTGFGNAILDGSGLIPQGRTGMITIRNASHVVVDGFDIRDFQTASAAVVTDTPVGILVEGTGEAITLQNNTISGIANRSSCNEASGCAVGANAIGVYGTTAAGLRDISVLGNEAFANTLAASETVTINGNVDGFTVEGNVVRDNNNIGFDFIGFEPDVCNACSADTNRARNGLVRDNQALRNSSVGNPWYAGQAGSAGGFYVDGGRNIVIERNTATGNDIGIEVGAEAPGEASTDVLVASNLIYNNGEAGLALGGFSPSATDRGGGRADRIQVANNTIYGNFGFGSEIFIQYRVSGLTVVNNIFISPADQSDAARILETPTSTEWRNNLWWADQAIDGVPVPDSSPLSEDPLLVNRAAGNARLQNGSPAEGMGGFVEDITDFVAPFWNTVFTGGVIPGAGSADLNGEPRIQGAIDVGATEKLP